MTDDPTAGVRRAGGDRIDVGPLYALLTLRVDVFVVEQRAAYRELDGADLRATTTHLWIEGPREGAGEGAGEEPALGAPIAGTSRRLLAGARLLAGPGVTELGRVVVASAHRRRGLGAALVRRACEAAGRPVHANAQAQLQAWYARFGFVTVGPAFDWEGLTHVPMRLDG